MIHTNEETASARLERLGRQRPPEFTSTWIEALFIFSIAMSQFLTEYFVSGFTLILPTLKEELDIPQATAVWPASAFSLAIGSTLLIFGRLGDMWGGYPVFLWGLGWLSLWSIVAGFSINPLMLDCCRALQGLGAAAALPTGVMHVGSIYRPGPRKNLVFAIYGISAVMGFFGGILIAGVVGEFLRWGFYFWIGAMLGAVTLISSILSISPQRKDADQKTRMDYLGAVTIVVGLTLTVFAIIESAHAPGGWRSPYTLVCVFLGLLSLVGAAYVEARVATDPLLPFAVLKVPSLTPLLIAVMFLYGTWGIFSVYGTLFFHISLSRSPLEIAVWYTPLGIAGLLLSLLEGLILQILPGRVLLIISALGALGSQLLLVFLPIQGWSYWPWIFPAMILSTIGIDLSTILMTVFITTKLPRKQQGLAGGLLNSVLQLGVAVVLGFADILQSATEKNIGLAESYKRTFWLGACAAGVSLVLMAIWGKVPKAKSELTAEEREEEEREAQRQMEDVHADRSG